jgi:hypothetical protein
MLDVGISSTRRIANFWGIDEVQPGRERRLVAQDCDSAEGARGALQPKLTNLSNTPTGVQKTIEDALRAAGLVP